MPKPGKVRISIHALLAESDCQWRRSVKLFRQFLSTLSLRRATDCEQYYIRAQEISIHALLAESDSQQPPGTTSTTYFYPRSPCGERPFMTLRHCTTYLFLSTLSLRRATIHIHICQYFFLISIHALLAESDNANLRSHRSNDNFYPRSPCGERHANLRRHRSNDDFYPRSPCGERRMILTQRFCASTFLSTLSLRRATNQ